MAELERRIFRLLREGDPTANVDRVLDLSDRDAARVLNRMEALEGSDVFLLKPLLEEARSLALQVRQLESMVQGGTLTSTERDLFDQLQTEIEGCSTQIGRKTEQLRLTEESILTLDKRIGDIELEIEKLYEKHNVSKEKADFIEECDAIASVLKPGVGKTQFLLKILTDIRAQSNYETNFIYFDYKGDLVDNARFLELARVQPFRLLQGGLGLPINPFILPSYDEQTINVSAREKAESFASISSKLGVVQKGALTEAIRAAYAKRAGAAAPYPDFQDVFEIAVAAYEADGKKDDSLIEILRDLSDFDLFWRHGSETPPMDRVSNRTMLIDVHAMPVLKELVAYLVIERLYKEMATMPDSPVMDGHRTVRTILVIDEAHNYLGQKNIFLQRIVREGRSKGVVVFFASQSPNDYQQKFFNFQELLEFTYIFQCDGVTSGSVQDILGCGARTAKDLQSEIARLEPWQVIARSQEKTEEFVKFTAEAFYKSYS